jgi:ankyrin repeat protein
LLADAPKVVVYLLKNGADISQEIEDYPNLTPLYMTIPRSLARSATEIDLALRIACSYALSKTATFLLTSGANANTTNSYGIAAIHAAVMRRRPWRELPLINSLLSRQYDHNESLWESMLLKTVSTLLEFGADIHLGSRTSRIHECDASCWKSIDCDHQCQTALHFASSNGIPAIVSRLLDAGADPNMPNAQGYTALYCALVQGHKDVALCILQRSNDILNPIVNTREQTTALHVACRFSFTEMVNTLLIRGVDANVIDIHGRTPLHDALTWANLEREVELLLTLECLLEFHADPDTTVHHLTPRRLAETHFSKGVRDMFSAPLQLTRVRYVKPILSKQSKSHDPNGPGNINSRGIKCKAESPKLLCSPDPQQMESKLEDSIWAPHKTTHLVKSFESSVKIPDLDEIVAIRDPFPNLTTKTERNVTSSAALVEGVWSESGTAQMIRSLELQTLPVKPTQHPQQPVEAFPVLRKPAGSSTRDIIQGDLNNEATQFWGSFTKQMTGARLETVMDGSENKIVQKVIARTETNSGKSRRRWTPLRF